MDTAYILMDENDDIFGICFNKETAFKESCEIAIDELSYDADLANNKNFLDIILLFEEEKDYRKCYYKLRNYEFRSACPIIKEIRIIKND